MQSRIDGKHALYLGLSPKITSILHLGIFISTVLPLGIYAYLGTFVRYMADDYCATVMLASEDLIRAIVVRYVEWTGGYSNLLFIQLGELFGKSGLVYMAAVTLVLWLVGLTWVAAELGKVSGLHWRIGLSAVLAALCISFSLYRTTNIYQVLFWRSSLVGYLAALVPLVFAAAFILYQLRLPYKRSRLIWSSVLVFVLVFITGGTSETIDALVIGLLLLSFVGLFLWRKSIRKEEWALLGTALAGALISLLVMALSPGNLARMGDVSTLPMPNFFLLGIESLTYALQYISDTFNVSPIPGIFIFLMPFLLFYGLQNPAVPSSRQALRKLIWLIVLLPLGMLIVVTFSFAPHAYARSFPSVYVRFPALFLLTVTLVAEGCLAGYVLGQIKSPATALARSLVLTGLLLTALYPLYASRNIYGLAHEFRTHAADWDARDAQIRKSVASGAASLVVVQLDTIGGVQEYKGNENFWINRCAAAYYGLQALRAP